MKKKSLISLSSLLLASALLVGCGSKTTNKQLEVTENHEDNQAVESEDNPQEDSSQGSNANDVVKYTITINLKGVELVETAQEKTSFLTRSGTLWSVLKKKAPTKEDIKTPDPTYIGEISYTYDEAGDDEITDATQIHEDTTLYLQITHTEPEESYCTVKWLNVGGSTLYPNEKYRSGETPFYKGATPVSDQHSEQMFTGWMPAISKIEPGDISSERTYVAQYEAVGVDCKVTYDLNYDGKKDVRKVKQNTTASPLNPAPVRQHYTLKGWYEEATCEHEFVFAEHTIVDDLTVIYAGWTPDKEKVTINPNGGTFSDDSTTTKQLEIDYGTTWGDVKTAHTEIQIKTNPVGTVSGYKYEYYDVTDGTWKEPADTLKIGTDLSIRVSYTALKATLKFEDAYEGGTMPGDKEIAYGTKWVEIKNDCLPSGVKDGFKFDHYYIGTSENPTVITDDYVFDLTSADDITFHAVYKVFVQFTMKAGDIEKGYCPHASDWIMTGTKWSGIKTTYEPKELQPSAWEFDEYLTNDTTPVAVDDTYVFRKNVILTAQFTNPAADRFANDSWETFTAYLDGKTFTDIIDPSEPYYDDYHGTEGGKVADTFVGLTRTVMINGEEYLVRVIDEAKTDSATLAHGNLFAFEFVSTFGLAVPYSLDTDNNNYDDSFINAYLNNYFIYSLPEALQGAIKSRTVEYFDTTAREVKNDLNQKVFTLSASEFGFIEYPDPDYGEHVANEGRAYAFYSNGVAINKRKKLNESGVAVNYWTRSADIYGSHDTAWYVDANGALGDVLGYSVMVNENNVYLAPAFEI